MFSPPLHPNASKIIRITSSQRKRLFPPFSFFSSSSSSSPSLFPLSHPSFHIHRLSSIRCRVLWSGATTQHISARCLLSCLPPFVQPGTLRALRFGTIRNPSLCNPRRGAKSPTLTTCSPGGLISRLLLISRPAPPLSINPSLDWDDNRRLILPANPPRDQKWPTKGLARIRPSTRAIKMLPALKYAPHGQSLPCGVDFP